MKKTLTINISGIIFNIDEDAYNRLQKYLEDINARFSNAEEGKEIVADIEARIAELFNAKVNNQKQVVTIDDLEEIIGIMGNPSDFGGEDHEKETQNESDENKKSEQNWRSKRIYRDPDHSVIGGVCGGLGSYFNLDPVIFRVLMVLTFFAFGPLLYIVLWVAIPKAKTTAQKLEMKGKKVNISNIEQNIREEFEYIKQNFKKMKESGETNTILEKIGHVFLVIFTSLAKVVVVFIGILLLIIGLALLFGFISTAIFGFSDISIGDHALSFSQVFHVFFNSDAGFLLLLSIILVSIIPIIGVLYGGVKLIFKIKTVNRIVGICLTSLWFFGLIYLIVFGISTASQFRYSGQADRIQKYDNHRKISYLKLKMNYPDSLVQTENSLNISNIYFDVINENPVMKGVPNLSIEKNDSNYIEVLYMSIARGETQKHAKETAKNIEYPLGMEKLDSTAATIVFTPFFRMGNIDKWRNQKLKIKVKIPVGDTIYLDKSIEKILFDVENTSNTLDEDMPGHKWVMKNEGLSLVQ